VPPDIVLVSIDSLRPDHLGAYGYRRPTSPHIDRIAEQGIVFTHAYATTSWTLPSHLSLLTGLYPGEHGIVDEGRQLAESIPLLPQLLARAGYRSAAVVSGPYLHRQFGFARGWEVYDDLLVNAEAREPGSDESHAQITSPRVHQRAVKLLDRLGEGPFLLFLHYFDVHHDYLPPSPWDQAFDPGYRGSIDGRNVETDASISKALAPRDREHLIALYDGEIRWVDEWIGQLDAELVRRRLDRRTLFVLTADHGEEFFEHGEKTHRKNLYDTTLRIPLVIRLPDRRFAGRQVAEPVSLVDLLPTLAAAAGVEPPAQRRGRDLLRTRFGQLVTPVETDLFAELRQVIQSVVSGPWKLTAHLRVRTGEPWQVELFDTASDAGEQHDLSNTERRRCEQLLAVLQATRRDNRKPLRQHPPGKLDLTKDVERKLHALGYL
jgi:arylsulfatase A-like enzyme